jgi:hypothetical protein
VQPGTLHDDVIRYFDDNASKTITAKPVAEGDHGRIETHTGHGQHRRKVVARRSSMA